MNWLKYLVGFLLLFNIAGCKGSLGALGIQNATTGTAEKIADATVDLIKDQGVMDKFLAGADVAFQDPAVERYMRMEAVIGARIAGVNGRAEAQTEGHGQQMSKDVQNALLSAVMGGQLDPATEEMYIKLLTYRHADTVGPGRPATSTPPVIIWNGQGAPPAGVATQPVPGEGG